MINIKEILISLGVAILGIFILPWSPTILFVIGAVIAFLLKKVNIAKILFISAILVLILYFILGVIIGYTGITI